MNAFDVFVEEIGRAYDHLGYELGGRFLYSPARTLSPETALAFVGVNPGGRRYEQPKPSVEEGNAYRVERWGPNGGLSPLQVQIGLLYEDLAQRVGHPSPAALMDETLAANFCPFRSPSWQALVNRTESVAFSRNLWSELLEHVRPRALICLGDLSSSHLRAALEDAGGVLLREPEECPVGWGAITYALAEYHIGSSRTLLLRLPHLSRFRIFGRPASARATGYLTGTIAAALHARA